MSTLVNASNILLILSIFVRLTNRVSPTNGADLPIPQTGLKCLMNSHKWTDFPHIIPTNGHIPKTELKIIHHKWADFTLTWRYVSQMTPMANWKEKTQGCQGQATTDITTLAAYDRHGSDSILSPQCNSWKVIHFWLIIWGSGWGLLIRE